MNSIPRWPKGAAKPLRLYRLCRAMQALTLLGALFVLGGALWVQFDPAAAGEWAKPFRDASSAALGDGARRFGAALALLPAALLLFGLFHLWRLFGLYAQGLALTVGAQRVLRLLALTVLAAALLRPLYNALLSVVATIDNPPGQRSLMLSFGTDDYFLLLLGLVLTVIASVMADAVRAAEENRSFV
jgi:hypothetical protein